MCCKSRSRMTETSSKELLYSEYTGNTVASHVLEIMEKRSKQDHRKQIYESFKKNRNSEAFERARRLTSLIEKEDASNFSLETLQEKSNSDIDGGIEVLVEVDDNLPDSKVNAWFLLKAQSEQKPKCSDGKEESVHNSSIQKTLDTSDSSDSSDEDSSEEDSYDETFLIHVDSKQTSL